MILDPKMETSIMIPRKNWSQSLRMWPLDDRWPVNVDRHHEPQVKLNHPSLKFWPLGDLWHQTRDLHLDPYEKRIPPPNFKIFAIEWPWRQNGELHHDTYRKNWSHHQSFSPRGGALPKNTWWVCAATFTPIFKPPVTEWPPIYFSHFGLT